jgi:paraquat-inducible protein B
MAAAKPEVTKIKTFTAIWIIPVVALVLGAWLVAYNFLTEGPEIEITFKSASGLEAGKTKVKFRDVEMGQVQEVTLSDDMEGVKAVVKMNRAALPLLLDDTRFWVVTASIGGGGISGLDTLLSGAYIEISPGTSNAKSLKFTGLEAPPLTPADAPGIRLALLSEGSSSVSRGDPVLFHGFKVGRVETMELDSEIKQLRYTIFIDAPYDKLVNSSVRFWDVSGVSFSSTASGLKFSTGSLNSILLGGVTFGTPPGFENGGEVDDNTVFRLFPSFEDILDTPYKHRAYYVVGFEQSVKGLLPKAPVQYRGIQIGQVQRLMISELLNKAQRENAEPRGDAIPVLIYLEPGRLKMPDTEESVNKLREVMTLSVKNGMRATMESSSLLTGARVIELNYFDTEESAKLGEFEGFETIPAIATGLSELEQKISQLLDKANALPLEKTVGSVNLAVGELNQSLRALRVILENDELRTIPGELQGTLEALRVILEDEGIRSIPDELQSTLAAARFQLQGDSAEAYQLGRTLKEVESAARALREFLDFLERKPESLIRGKKNTEE